MSSSSEKIIAKIEEEKIKPRPKWQFAAKQYSVVTLGLVALIMGSLSFSLVLYLINNQDWGLRTVNHSRFLMLIFFSLPFAWLVFLILFIIFIFYNFLQLKKGYKYSRRTIILSALLIIFFFGSLAAGFGLHRKINQTLSKQVPFYRRTFDPRPRVWGRPQLGFLAGTISNLDDDSFVIKDPNNNKWRINIQPETIMAPEMDLVLDEQIKIVGIIDGDNNFTAAEILPWERQPGLIGPPASSGPKTFHIIPRPPRP